jgi:TRAP-type C4-dicarboxylate transport system substrate-binding protein
MKNIVMSKTMNNIFKNLVLILAMMFPGFYAPALYAKAIKIATISPDGTFWMEQMRAGAKEIEEKTRGRVKFKFYPGGVMGNDENVLRKIRIGQLHGGAITIGQLSGFTPDVTVYGLPFLFSSLDEADEVRKVTDPMLIELIEKNGFITFGFAQGGFTYLMSKEPVHSFDELKQQKSWVPEKSDVGLSVYRHIGITPVSLPLSDVLTGLQTGLINTIISSPIGALALQWHTHVRYVVDLPLNYLAAMLVIDKKVFDRLKESDQAVVRDVMTKVYKKIDAHNKTDSVAAREALKNNGVKFIKLSAKEKNEWFQAGDAVTEEMTTKYHYDDAFYRAVSAHKQLASESQ